MSLALFFTNVCVFKDCGLNFATLYDLIQHIEETHIPGIESELKRKEDQQERAYTMGQTSTVSAQQQQTQAIPLSCLCRVFPVLPAQRAKPTKLETTGCSFNHNKKRSTHQTSSHGLSFQTQTKPIDRDADDISNDSFREDFDEWSNGDVRMIPETAVEGGRRFRCPVDDCTKRYKNMQGVRYHAKQAHGRELEQPPSAACRPYKCTQCSKRYKTTNGLQNHLAATHQQQQQQQPLSGMGPSSKSGSNTTLVPVSPSAVSNAEHQTNPASVRSNTSTPIPSPASCSSIGLFAQTSTSGTSAKLQQVQSSLKSSTNANYPRTTIGQMKQPIQQTAPPPTAAGHHYQQTPPHTPTLLRQNQYQQSNVADGGWSMIESTNNNNNMNRLNTNTMSHWNNSPSAGLSLTIPIVQTTNTTLSTEQASLVKSSCKRSSKLDNSNIKSGVRHFPYSRIANSTNNNNNNNNNSGGNISVGKSDQMGIEK